MTQSYRTILLALLASTLSQSSVAAQLPGFSPPEEITTPSTRIPQALFLSVGDADGDGHPDITALPRDNYPVVVGGEVSLFLQPALGLPSTPAIASTSLGDVVGARLVDVNQDGLDDLLSWRLGGDVLLSLRRVDATYEDGTVIGRFQISSFVLKRFTGHVEPALVDLDADGDLDLVGFGPGGLLIYDQIAPGVFNTAPRVILPTPPNLIELIVDDLDGDGVDDVVVSAGNPYGIRWLRNDGSGDLVDQGRLFPTTDLQRTQYQTHDLDGDGTLDLVYADATDGAIMARPGLGAGHFDPVPTPLVGLGGPNIRFELADFDRDGELDVLMHGWFNTVQETRLAMGRPGFNMTQPAREPKSFDRVAVADVDLDGDPDLVLSVYSTGEVMLRRSTRYGARGVQECAAAQPNSTGERARIEAIGSSLVADDRLELRAFDLPTSSFSFFLCSLTADSVPNVGGGAGTLCLGGEIGRFVGSGELQQAGPSGQIRLEVTPSALPQPTGSIAAMTGTTWRFQGWYRDAAMGQATSNLTDVVAVTFE